MKRLLEQANTGLMKGKLNIALGLLLKAWKKKRAPELADLIDSVSEACSARLQPLPPRLAIDDLDAWRELSWEHRPEDFERLFAVLDELPANALTQFQLEGSTLNLVSACSGVFGGPLSSRSSVGSDLRS